jgi:hypothetical protein
MLSVNMLNVVMLSVVMLSVVMLNVVAPILPRNKQLKRLVLIPAGLCCCLDSRLRRGHPPPDLRLPHCLLLPSGINAIKLFFSLSLTARLNKLEHFLLESLYNGYG